jgi:DNA-binding LacI/PurR family transcriptional regulator
MRVRRKPLKFEVVADALRRQILGGFFPGNRLPRKLELVEHFGVSQKTIESALRVLREEGLLTGIRGTGTFLTEVPAASNLTHLLTVVLMPLTGHFYGHLYDALRREFLESNLYLVSYDLQLSGPDTSLLQMASFSTLLSAPIRGVLVHGGGYWRHPFLERWRNLNSVFLDIFDAPGEPPGSAALIDYRDGGRQIAKEFLQRGCRKLLYIARKFRPDVPDTPAFRKNHPVFNLLEGLRDVLPESPQATLDFHQTSINQDCHDAEIEEILQKDFDAILCNSDVLAYKTGEVAHRIGKVFPRDFLLAGCFNTPWSQDVVKPFPSLDMNVQEVSRQALRLLNSNEREIVKITPKFIWR